MATTLPRPDVPALRRAPWRRVKADGLRLLTTTCALFAVLTALPPSIPWFVPVALALIPTTIFTVDGLKRVANRSGRNFAARDNLTRALLALLPAALYVHPDHDHQVIGWVGVSLVAIIPVLEPILAKVANGRRFRAAGLPGIKLRNYPALPMNALLLANSIAIVAAVLTIIFELPAWVLIVIAAVAFTLVAVVASDTLQRVFASVHAESQLFDTIDAYKPKFIVYYGVPTGSEYQIAMWLPYLERIGVPFIVVLRHASTFRKVSAMTSAPVVLRASMRGLDDVLVPSISAAFYVNNGALNAHLVRYPQITHVQLLHGDSDKATSFNPITAMFDKIFVAGQAGIDRYANNNVVIPLEKFEIVGRPQVEAVDVRSDVDRSVRSVLYAPTWRGHFADTNYCSLPAGPTIIAELVSRGVRVVFRPHPYSYKESESLARVEEIQSILQKDAQSSGLNHLWGAAAESERSVFECFNEVDAMISDVSSVVPDFLYSEKPFALVAMTTTPEDFAEEFPLARAAYVIDRETRRLQQVLGDLLGSDPLINTRRATKVYYLGDFAAEHYADGFVGAARRLCTADSKAQLSSRDSSAS